MHTTIYVPVVPSAADPLDPGFVPEDYNRPLLAQLRPWMNPIFLKTWEGEARRPDGLRRESPVALRPLVLPEADPPLDGWPLCNDGGCGLCQEQHFTPSRTSVPANDMVLIQVTWDLDPAQNQHYPRDHPVDRICQAAAAIREGDADLGRMLHGAVNEDDRRVVVPGQGGGPWEGVGEGVALVLCQLSDWDGAPDPDSVTTGPAWQELISGAPVDLAAVPPGSYVSADGRAVLLTIDLAYGVHGGSVDTAWDETWPAIQELAFTHAVRSYDVLAAAQLTDRLRRAVDPDLLQRDLTLLRQVQARLAARHVASLLTGSVPDQFGSADEAAKVEQALRATAARLDRSLSDAFAAFLPVLEASEAALRQRRDDDAAEARAAAAARAESEQKQRSRLTEVGGTLVAGAGLLALFSSFAAIPRDEVVFDPSARAGYATVACAVALAAVAYLVHISVGHRFLSRWARGWARVAGGLGAAAAAGFALYGSLGPTPRNGAALLGVVTLAVASSCLLLASVKAPDVPAGPSPAA